MPPVQLLHVAEPTAEAKRPGKQAIQVEELTAATAVEYWPAKQLLHVLLPKPEAYVPPVQLPHAAVEATAEA